MLVKFVLPTQPAGSTGGLTLYKNGQQLAGRARAMPTIVRSNAHNVPMQIIAQLSVCWETPLSDADRIGWGSYAYNTPLTDAYGNPRYIRGYAHYMRSNRPRLQFACPRIDTPPAANGLPSYTLPTITLAADNSTVTVGFATADTWANQTGSYMYLWQSKATNPTRNRPQEVYKPLGMIAGNSTTPPTSPVVFAAVSGSIQGELAYFVRSSVSLADGRLSGL